MTVVELNLGLVVFFCKFSSLFFFFSSRHLPSVSQVLVQMALNSLDVV